MDDRDRSLLRTVAHLSTVGISLVAATVIGLYLGLTLDEWLGTAPWCTVGFLLLGIIAGFRNLFLYARRGRDVLDRNGRSERK